MSGQCLYAAETTHIPNFLVLRKLATANYSVLVPVDHGEQKSLQLGKEESISVA